VADHNRASSLRWHLLKEAAEERALINAARPVFVGSEDGSVQTEPSRVLGEVRAELETLLRGGQVELRDSAPHDRVLSLTEALAVLADEESWTLGGRADRSVYLWITDSGYEEYLRD
jgi:hypothetical protein